MRDGHPYSYIDLERDPDVQNLLDSFHPQPAIYMRQVCRIGCYVYNSICISNTSFLPSTHFLRPSNEFCCYHKVVIFEGLVLVKSMTISNFGQSSINKKE